MKEKEMAKKMVEEVEEKMLEIAKKKLGVVDRYVIMAKADAGGNIYFIGLFEPDLVILAFFEDGKWTFKTYQDEDLFYAFLGHEIETFVP